MAVPLQARHGRLLVRVQSPAAKRAIRLFAALATRNAVIVA